MRGCFVVAVACRFELESRVLHTEVEVGGDTVLELVEDVGGVAIPEAVVIDDDVRGQNGQVAGYLAGVEVML